MIDDLPDVHFGSVDSTPPDWRKVKMDDAVDEDEALPKTPPDVVAMLGFDPLLINQNADRIKIAGRK